MTYCEVAVTGGPSAKVSQADFQNARRFNWWKCSGYAARSLPRNGSGKSGKKFNQLMHVLIMGARPGFEIDHVNGDKLDNRRENLRFVTHSANLFNSGRHRADRTRGTNYVKRLGKWRAYIKINHIQRYLGLFSTEAATHERYLKEKEAVCK